MKKMDIPLAIPYMDENEVDAVASVIRSHWVAQGAKVMEFERMMADFVGVRFGVATNSCTSALHLSLHLLGNPAWRRGDLSFIHLHGNCKCHSPHRCLSGFC